MNHRLWQTAVERAGRLAAPLALDELPDADLLGRFTAAREEPVFAAIVRRHGPLVWGVCRGLSATEADAEDAFQATFLALVRSAAKVRQPNALGAWLHRVAGRVCRNGLRTRTRRAKHERAAAVAEAACPVSEAAWDRWHNAVHAEIDRLPDALRVPFVLCVLQGVRQGEAARRLGWKIGTVSGRVCKAKQALADAITRRGLTGAAGLAGVAGGGMLAGPLSAALLAKGTVVIRPAVGSGVSTTVIELARGATGGVMGKTKLLAAAVLVGGLTLAAVGTKYSGTAEAQGLGGAPPGAGAGPPPGNGPKAAPPGIGAGAPGAAGSPDRPPAGGGLSGGGSGPAHKVEYKFVPRPDGADKFKSTLVQLGNDGWEYVGWAPDNLELIFKRLPRPMAGGMGGMAMGGMGPAGLPAGFGGASGFGPMPPGAFGGGGSFPGAGFGGGPAPPKREGPRPGPGGIPPGAVPGGGGGEGAPGFAPGGGNKPAENLELKVGETVRHRMNRTIDRVHVKEPKVAEVTLDPTDPKRVIIKSLAAGGTQLELTDDLGSKEKVTIRVR